jgi:hypothetical protein
MARRDRFGGFAVATVSCITRPPLLGGKDRLQAFTLIGTVNDDRVYQADMGEGFHPFRRDVTYAKANEAPILPLLDKLELTRGKRNWGYSFRFGLVEISKHDFDIIAAAMGVVGDA